MFVKATLFFVLLYVIIPTIMVVRMRHTRAHTGNRRSHHALQNANILTCNNCNSPIRNHSACTICGFYKGKLVKAIKTKKSE